MVARRRKTTLVVLGLGGVIGGAGLLATGALAAPCLESTSRATCAPTRPVGPVVEGAVGTAGDTSALAGAILSRQAATADAAARSTGLTGGGSVSVPVVSGSVPLPPVGPSPVGDVLRVLGGVGDAAIDQYEQAEGRVTGGGEVSVPVVSGSVPLPPVGPSPVGDVLHAVVDPLFPSGGGSAPAVEAVADPRLPKAVLPEADLARDRPVARR